MTQRSPPSFPLPPHVSGCEGNANVFVCLPRVGWCTWALQRPHLHSKAINSSVRLLGSLKNIQAPALTRWLLYWYWSGQSVRALVHLSQWVVVICACNRGGRRRKTLLNSSKTTKIKHFQYTLFKQGVFPVKKTFSFVSLEKQHSCQSPTKSTQLWSLTVIKVWR